MAQFLQSSTARRRQHLARASRRAREACADAASPAELVDGLCGPLNDALGLSGLLLGSTDPSTAVISTATCVENLPNSMAEPWMHNEVLEDDVNKFTELHRTAAGTTSLHRATQGSPRLSPRYRLNLQMGLGPELRTTFSANGECWGVANLVREAADPDFDDHEIAWLEQLRPDIASALQTTLAVATVPPVNDRVPGVVTLDAEARVQSMTDSARELLADLWMCPIEGLGSALPGEAYMVATIARAQGTGLARHPAARTRVQGRSGGWITVQGECISTLEREPSGVALVLEPSRPADILPLIVASYGLTAREREVLAEMSSGRTAVEMAPRLFISEHTVRDHIKSILSKTGTSSRGELMSMLFQHRA